MKPRILVVDDEKEIADTMTYALSSENYEPIWVHNGELALQALEQQNIDLCILDIGLPNSNGFDLLKSIRLSKKPYHDIPVIFLTARSEEIDRIVGLEIGADDYVCKPFSPREVVARVKVILKRAERNIKDSNSTKTVKPDSFEHKVAQRIVHYNQQAIDLTRAEYELLVSFLAQPKRVFSRRQLIENIWSSNHPSDDRAIDTHIKTLRAKLKTHNPHKEFIVTHRGFGYSFEP